MKTLELSIFKGHELKQQKEVSANGRTTRAYGNGIYDNSDDYRLDEFMSAFEDANRKHNEKMFANITYE